MDSWLNSLSSRANALKTDDELRAEFEAAAGPGPKARKFRDRLETFLTNRNADKLERATNHRRAPFNAQKDHLRKRD